MNEQLIAENRKISVVKVMTKNKHKPNRERINYVRMLFNEEPVGTKLFVKNIENGFEISKTNNGGFEKSVSIVKTRSAIQKPQTYLNFTGLLTESGYYNIYRENNVYILKKQKKKAERKNHLLSNNQVMYGSSGAVRLPKAWIETSFKNLASTDCMFVIKEFYHPYCYATVKVVRKEDAKNIGTIRDIRASVLERTTDLESFTKKQSCNANVISLSRFFKHASGINIRDILIYKTGASGELILEPAKNVCEICGCRIDSRIKYRDWNVCSPCNSAAKIANNYISNNNCSLKTLREELMNVENQLKQLMEEN